MKKPWAKSEQCKKKAKLGSMNFVSFSIVLLRNCRIVENQRKARPENRENKKKGETNKEKSENKRNRIS